MVQEETSDEHSGKQKTLFCTGAGPAEPPPRAEHAAQILYVCASGLGGISTAKLPAPGCRLMWGKQDWRNQKHVRRVSDLGHLAGPFYLHLPAFLLSPVSLTSISNGGTPLGDLFALQCCLPSCLEKIWTIKERQGRADPLFFALCFAFTFVKYTHVKDSFSWGLAVVQSTDEFELKNRNCVSKKEYSFAIYYFNWA